MVGRYPTIIEVNSHGGRGHRTINHWSPNFYKHIIFTYLETLMVIIQKVYKLYRQ